MHAIDLPWTELAPFLAIILSVAYLYVFMDRFDRKRSARRVDDADRIVKSGFADPLWQEWCRANEKSNGSNGEWRLR